MTTRSPSDSIKALLTMDQVVRRYGFTPNRAGYICCPFHREKTPSMKIYPEDGGFHCFGCGAHGSVIDFVMRLFDLSFQQAIVRLSSDFNLGLTARRPTERETSRILQERREREEERRRLDLEYREKMQEHRYWFWISKAGPDHWLYDKAVKQLPYLEWWLDENIEMGSRR